ncbi:MAG TPA: hypothetical protein VK497_03805 [Candidatus Saccharimonadales bacterium]|nr:hypothetical protein [Candidatus Saccharimonadales bacterium]
MEWIFYLLVGMAIYLLLDSIANSIVRFISTQHVMHNDAKVKIETERTEQARLELEKAKVLSGDSADSRIIDD